MQQFGRDKGMNIGEVIENRTIEVRSFRDVQQAFDGISKLGNIQLLVVIIPMPFRIPCYEWVKQVAELQKGYITQCIKSETVEKRMSPSTVVNILQKINTKLNGTNHKIDLLPRENPPYIVFGADVTHPSPGSTEPSFAAVTGSCDLEATKYGLSLRIQDSRLEIIEDLEAIVEFHIKLFTKNTKVKPKHIIFYRDGVGDGQFPEVKAKEIGAIKRACAKTDCPSQITFVIVQKRHHTRFFPANEEAKIRGDKNSNVHAGTCVDTTITDKTALDFYLISHRSIQGVARPTKYWVLYDDANMSADAIEKLTFYLCHLYMRCTRAVSYPTPTYYAHLGALRAKAYCKGVEWAGKDLRQIQREKCVRAELNNFPMYFV